MHAPGRRALAAAGLGALATLAFEPVALWPLWPLCLAATLWLAARRRPLHAAWIGGAFGVGQYLAGLYWTVISTHVYGGAPAWLGVLLWCALAVYLSLYAAASFALAAWLGWRRGGAGAGAGFVSAWVLAELVRGWFFSGFPWLTAGYALVGTPFDRLAAVGGVFALTALAVGWAWLLRCLPDRPLPALAGLLLSVALLALPAPSRWTQPQGEPLDVAMIQGNVAQDEKWLPSMREPTWQRYRDMSRAALPADLLVWPEVALTVPLAVSGPRWLQPLGAELAAQGSSALVGVMRFEGQLPYNSVVAIGASSGRYDKRHLVPFGEYFPVPDWVRPIMEAVGTPYGDVGFGRAGQPRITVAGQALALSICFEDAFGSEIARDAREAGLLVNLTNDAWFADSTAPHQHFQIARARAVETGRDMVRVANTGISAHIDADGRVRARSAQFETVTLRARVQPRAGLTPYQRWLDTPLWLGAAAVLLLLSWRSLPRRPES